MTREEWFSAIGDAFANSMATASDGYWVANVATTPVREIAFTPDFVNNNIQGGQLTPTQLTDKIKSIPESQWIKLSDGRLSATVR